MSEEDVTAGIKQEGVQKAFQHAKVLDLPDRDPVKRNAEYNLRFGTAERNLQR